MSMRKALYKVRAKFRFLLDVYIKSTKYRRLR